MHKLVTNFSAGPAMLPREVMQQAQAEFINWNDSGRSILEISHRSEIFEEIVVIAEENLREIAGISDDYEILFLAGGATQQFSAIPLNLGTNHPVSDYLHTGIWSAKAMAEAKRYISVNSACSSADSEFLSIPEPSSWKLNPDAAYCYYTANETINGLAFNFIPDTCGVPLVADMTSIFLAQSIDVSDFGLIFAGAQKNIAPAGMTIVIIHESLLQKPMPPTPKLLCYQDQVKAGSMLNTPPIFNWYMAGLMFDWIKQQGGVDSIALRNQKKAETLYQFIDASECYQNDVEHSYRSITNVVFRLSDEGLNSLFLAQAEQNGLCGLAGHRLVGGMRASLYNAISQDDVEYLVQFMDNFQKSHT